MTASLTELLLRRCEAGQNATLAASEVDPDGRGDLDRLVAVGVLEELAMTRAWTPCADCDCAIGFRPIRRIGERIVAACPADPGSDVDLAEEDLREYRIDAERLLCLVADATGLEGSVEVVAPGLWRLGTLGSARAIIVALPGRALRAPGAVLLLRSAGGPMTVLASKLDQASRLRLLEAGIELAPLTLDASHAPGAVAGLQLAERVASPGGAELVVRRGAGAIEWRGATIGFTHQQFPVLLRLIEGSASRNRVVSGPAIEGTTGREAKDLIRELRQRVEGAGFSGADAKSLVRAVHGRGYALGVPRERTAVVD